MNDDLSERSSTLESRRSLNQLNGGLLVVLAWGCTLLGCTIGAMAARPEILNALSTLELLGIFTLAAAPPLTLLALRHDRKIACAAAPPASAVHPVHRSAIHPAHERSTSVHTRVIDTNKQPKEIEPAA